MCESVTERRWAFIAIDWDTKYKSRYMQIHETSVGYYADGEDAYDMRRYFKKKKDAATAK